MILAWLPLHPAYADGAAANAVDATLIEIKIAAIALYICVFMTLSISLKFGEKYTGGSVMVLARTMKANEGHSKMSPSNQEDHIQVIASVHRRRTPRAR